MLTRHHNLHLLPFERKDAPTLKRWAYDPAHKHFFKDVLALTDEQLEIYAYLKDGHGFLVSVKEREEWTPIGFALLYEHKVVSQTIKFGILIDPAYQRQGHCGQALRILAEYVFHRLNIYKCIAEVMADNAEIQHMLEKGGFVFECLMKDESKIDGQRKDVARYYLTSDRYAALHPRSS